MLLLSPQFELLNHLLIFFNYLHDDKKYNLVRSSAMAATFQVARLPVIWRYRDETYEAWQKLSYSYVSLRQRRLRLVTQADENVDAYLTQGLVGIW
jgi:hypothetical protein